MYKGTEEEKKKGTDLRAWSCGHNELLLIILESNLKFFFLSEWFPFDKVSRSLILN